MQDHIFIKSFLFNKASYFVHDGNGDKVLLSVNYKENTFTMTSKGKTVNSQFRKEVEKKVKDMLSRKHGVDFA